MNYYNNISNILFEFLYIFQFLEQKFPIGTEKTGESNPKSKLNSNSRIVEKVWAKLDNVSRASADRKVEVIPPIIKPDLPAEIAKRVLSFSLSSAERKLPFYSREWEGWLYIEGHQRVGVDGSTAIPSIDSIVRRKEYIPLSVLLSTFFSGALSNGRE